MITKACAFNSFRLLPRWSSELLYTTETPTDSVKVQKVSFKEAWSLRERKRKKEGGKKERDEREKKKEENVKLI